MIKRERSNPYALVVVITLLVVFNRFHVSCFENIEAAVAVSSICFESSMTAVCLRTSLENLRITRQLRRGDTWIFLVKCACTATEGDVF